MLVDNYDLAVCLVGLCVVSLQDLEDLCGRWAFARVFLRAQAEELHHALVGSAQRLCVQGRAAAQPVVVRVLVKVLLKRLV